MASKLMDQTIRAAISEFARAGFAGAATKTIAASARVTEGTLFRLFGSKEKLFEFALRRSVAEAFPAGALVDGLQGDARSIEEVAELFGNAIRIWTSTQTPEALRLSDAALLERPALARSVYLTEMSITNGVLAEVIERFQDEGLLRKDVRAALAAQFLILAIMRHRSLSATSVPDARPLGSLDVTDGALDVYINLWVYGLAAPKAKRSASK